MIFSFEINEKPIGKERPRVNTKTGKVYTPTKTSNFEDKVKWAFKSKYNIETEPSTNEFSVKLVFEFEPAKSLSNKKKENLYGKGYNHKPDIDNLSKSILDSLNGIVYKDDAQVTILLAVKEYATENKILVEMEEM